MLQSTGLNRSTSCQSAAWALGISGSLAAVLLCCKQGTALLRGPGAETGLNGILEHQLYRNVTASRQVQGQCGVLQKSVHCLAWRLHVRALWSTHLSRVTEGGWAQ
jgi:hypothetical protein